MFLEFADCDINEIDDNIIGRYFEKIKYKTNEEGETIYTSSSYKQATWSALNQFFSYLAKRNIIRSNPMENTERPSKKDNVKRIFLTLEDLNSILNTVKRGAGSQKAIAKQKEWVERDILIMFLFMNTGMRKTALSEINIEDISFGEKTLEVTDKRNKTQIYNITDEMEQAIKIWLRKREALLNGERNDALFISSLRKRMSEKAIYNLVQKYSEEALGYSISPHKLRAAFVSLYYEASGGDIKATCEAVGHADISTTNIYITKRNDSRKAAQNFMSQNLKM
jgi:site-specific recombinase XerD